MGIFSALRAFFDALAAFFSGERDKRLMDAGAAAERARALKEATDAAERAARARDSVDHSPDAVMLDPRNRDRGI